jgi:anti-sigma regulatory factor (Ser/Thr protein kinase)
VLWEWDLTELAEAAELIVSELATNAVQASAGVSGDRPSYDEQARLKCIWLRLAANQRQVLVEVGDSDSRPPVTTAATPEVEHGRGLLLVEAISDQWGYYYPAGEQTADDWRHQAARKVEWALVGDALFRAR